MSTELPPELRNNDPDGFAWGVWHDRTPKLIAQIRDAHPYEGRQRRALDALWEEIESGPIRPLPSGAHDAERWASWSDDHLGERWKDAPFLWSESFFYRRLLAAIDFFTPGPWGHVDPFEYLKSAELRANDAERRLSHLARTATVPAAEQALVKLLASLWGNRADLGFRIGRHQEAAAAGLVLDHSAQLLEALSDSDEVILVTDNAGQELLADLVLVDHLLAGELYRKVRLHVKPYPYYVSDATTADVVACIFRLTQTPASSAVADRIKTAAAAGRFILQTHEFYCAPLSYDRMPDDLADQFAHASLTLMKGDLNYRRLVGDRAWPPTTPFAQTITYFPGAVATLRTLKSDVVVGLSPETIAAQDGADGTWRTDGTRGIIQLHTP